MNQDEARLFRHTATKENGAGFCATREAGMARVSPLTTTALNWLNQHVPAGPDVTRIGEDLIVEMRYFPALAEAIMAAGFTFERDALPN